MYRTKARVLFLIFCCVFVINISAQDAGNISWEDILEQLSMDDDEESPNWENEIEELSDLASEPINLNTATKEQLERFPFLTDIQIEKILAYIYIHGQMQTIYELQMVENMDRQTIQYLLPFVFVSKIREKEPIPSVKNILKYGKQEITTRLDIPFYKRKGYKGTADSDNTYLGHPMYHSLRYSFQYRDKLYAGLTGEKDTGEPLFALHNKKGYDYYSFYFFLRNINHLKALAIGNYRLSFGQGLVISNDFTMGKTTSAGTLYTRNSGIKKHSSTDEYNYFRGLAATVQWGDFTVSGFYSHRSYDGIVTDSTITSIQKTGLHRTAREAGRKNVATSQLMGGNITYTRNNLKIGLTGVYYFFDRPYQPQLREYSKYNLRGNYFYNAGLNYKYMWNGFTLTGEAAVGKKGGIAALNSINYSLLSGYTFMLIHRYYDHNYRALYARAFSEGGYVQNENGWYFAAETTSIKYWRLFLSVDFFSFPWWKYGIDASSQGTDGMFQATYTPNNRLTMLFRYRYKKKDKNYTDEEKVKTIRPLHHHRLRYQLKYAPVDNLSLRTTLDYNHIHPAKASASQGYQVVQAVSYTFAKLPLRVEVQGSYFRTDDYASRVYASEKGLLYTFYTPSYYGHGSRMGAYVRWDIHKNWMVIGKYGQTMYYDRDEIGSGQDVISGSKKADLQLQLRVKF